VDKNPEHITISERELHRLVKETVHETLSSIGLEANQIGEVQRDFIFLRSMRMTHEKVTGKALLTIVGLLATATITLLVMGFRSFMSE